MLTSSQCITWENEDGLVTRMVSDHHYPRALLEMQIHWPHFGHSELETAVTNVLMNLQVYPFKNHLTIVC